MNATTSTGCGATLAAWESRTAQTQLERVVLIAILLVVGALAGLASFTHVHDWTMDNSPSGTPGRFGWTNAAISELVPIAALLMIRQRRRVGGSRLFRTISSHAMRYRRTHSSYWSSKATVPYNGRMVSSFCHGARMNGVRACRAFVCTTNDSMKRATRSARVSSQLKVPAGGDAGP